MNKDKEYTKLIAWQAKRIAELEQQHTEFKDRAQSAIKDQFTRAEAVEAEVERLRRLENGWREAYVQGDAKLRSAEAALERIVGPIRKFGAREMRLVAENQTRQPRSDKIVLGVMLAICDYIEQEKPIQREWVEKPLPGYTGSRHKARYFKIEEKPPEKQECPFCDPAVCPDKLEPSETVDCAEEWRKLETQGYLYAAKERLDEAGRALGF